MDMADALTITGLGMGVVFTGLLLTALLITMFSVIPNTWERLRSRAAAPAPDGTAPPRSEQPVDPEVLAVITAVLEIERRLYLGDPGGRLTITRR